MTAVDQTTPPKKARFLIVEDEAIIAHDIETILEDLGYGVLGIVDSCDAALAWADQHAADLVIMDVHIKGEKDGIQTAEKLQRLHKLPVVYLSGDTDDATLERASATLPLGYITKPISPGSIKATVAVALQRHRMQQHLEEREEWLHVALRATTEALIITDGHGVVTFLNFAAEVLAGVSRSVACGKLLDEVLTFIPDGAPKKRDSQPVQKISSFAAARQPFFTMGVLRRPDEIRIPVLLSVAALQAACDPGGTIVVIRDISALQKGQDECGESDSFASRDAMALSRSLEKTFPGPFSPGHFRMGESPGEKPAEEYAEVFLDGNERDLQEISQECERVSSLRPSVMEFAVAMILDRSSSELTDAGASYRQALVNLQNSIGSASATIRVSALPSVYIHQTALILIFQNLIRNALEHSGRSGPRVLVSAVRAGAFWKFTVADDGAGFAPEVRDRLWETAEFPVESQSTGKGLGLTICKRLIERHGGRIWGQSVPDHGAQFHFTLRGAPPPPVTPPDASQRGVC